MNLVNATEYTNPYIKAAAYRSKLHDIFINNKYGFTSTLIRYIHGLNYSKFHIVAECPEICVGPYEGMPTELVFNYSLKENGLGSPNWDIRDIYTIMYVDILDTLSTAVIDVIGYIHDQNIYRQCGNTDEFEDLYNFILECENTRGIVTMLFDIQIYMDHFVFRI